MNHGLGRLFSFDARDANHSVEPLIRAAAPYPRNWRYWNGNGWWGDQGSTPQCVAYSWIHWLEDGPVLQGGTAPCIVPQSLYDAAQLVDEWPGEGYDGTSVRAGAKVLQSKGFISAYNWATTLDEVIQCVLMLGPLSVGTNWYNDMFEPDPATHFIRVGGGLAGGHAFQLNGVNITKRTFRIKNSWGRSWGKNGYALISFDDFARLLSESGEACTATEVSK